MGKFLISPTFRYAEPLNVCIDNHNELAVCANNCLGVDPNAVVIAGTALTTASAFGFLGPISLQTLGVGLFGAFTLGGGAYMMSGAGGLCMGPLFCITGQGRCCLIDNISNPVQGFQCPDTC